MFDKESNREAIHAAGQLVSPLVDIALESHTERGIHPVSFAVAMIMAGEAVLTELAGPRAAHGVLEEGLEHLRTEHPEIVAEIHRGMN